MNEMPWGGGGKGLLLLVLMLLPVSAFADELIATREDGTEIARLSVPEGTEWCVLWNHSVQGFPVADCYENQAGQMVLMHAHLPDFAAGLDHILVVVGKSLMAKVATLFATFMSLYQEMHMFCAPVQAQLITDYRLETQPYLCLL